MAIPMTNHSSSGKHERITAWRKGKLPNQLSMVVVDQEGTKEGLAAQRREVAEWRRCCQC